MRIRRIIKNSVVDLFDIFGLDIHRKGLIKSYLKDVLAHLKRLGFNPEVVIDVGVAFGTHDLYEAFPHAKHLLIEPLIEYKPWISNILRKYNAECVYSAAGEKESSVEIT